LLNRFVEYPRQLRRMLRERGGGFDAFHLVDHSYAHLIHTLPAGRVGVYCHDLDTFRCLVEPSKDPRPLWFRRMVRQILTGLQKAAVVFHSTRVVRDEIVRHGLVDERRLVHAPPGVAEEFFAVGPDDGDRARRAVSGRYILHVGSCIPRKRIDMLLEVFAVLAGDHADLRLVQVGGEWTDAQRRMVERIGAGRIIQRRGIDRTELAALYAGASMVIFPSEAEGFGLPLVEALAAGAMVLASDIPVLREVGGDAAAYAPVGDVAGWTATASELLVGRGAPPVETRSARAARYTWSAHAATTAGAYRGFVT
jgi:glycosyltransferase involved in cell wall biosynthesis